MGFEKYFLDQSGGGNIYEGPLWQSGGAIRGYAGRDIQYGSGLRSFGRAIMRYAKPILKYLGQQGLKTGVSIGSDVLSGNDVQESIKTRMKESGAAIIDDTAAVVKKKLTGRGMARRRRTYRKKTNKKASTGRRRTVRRKRSKARRGRKRLGDIFT